MSDRVSPKNFPRWFDPRRRQLGTWAFILNRITAAGLVVYLGLHLVALGQLARGPDGYDSFLELVHHPLFTFGELLVVAAVIIHGLNGLRIVLTSFGIGVARQKTTFLASMAVSAVLILYFAYRMFGAG